MNVAHPASFRDPSGFVFVEDRKFFRKILPPYFKQYEHFIDGDLYSNLVERKWLLSHKEVSRSAAEIVLEPEQLDFVSYPYEWSVKQLVDAALLTLRVHREALSAGMILKDASAYNIAFHKNSPILIDTLSFDFYVENTPWRAFGQFLSHFLAPLCITKFTDEHFLRQLIGYLDGVPLEVVRSYLPIKAYVSPFVLFNLILPARYATKHQSRHGESVSSSSGKLQLSAQLRMIDALIAGLDDMSFSSSTEWEGYYSHNNYTDQAASDKKNIIQGWFNTLSPQKLWDLGGNDGEMSLDRAKNIESLIVSDIDENCIASCYERAKNQASNIYPVVSDFCSPSPGIGLGNSERDSFLQRMKDYRPDLTLALAIIHHLSLGRNVPFSRIAEILSGITDSLIIEFPDRDDSMVRYLLEGKREFVDHFNFYTRSFFEESFCQYFQIRESIKIKDSNRTLYLMQVK